MTFVATLDPSTLWQHFDHILTIPRGSKQEDEMRAYVVSVAEKHGLDYRIDDTGNMVVIKPGTAGHEGGAITILQSHLDMVNEKNSDVDHDFTKDAIQPQLDGEYLKASGTTLGSDNGIGVASMLAILGADDLVHGPLEMLFTIDEESGLTGAQGLDPSILHGKRLINLDSEEEGALCVGCAGGADSTLTLALDSVAAPAGAAALRASLRGLKGGHSGVDIHLQRGNATKLLNRALYAVGLDRSFQVASLEGGNMHNAIPREATAVVVIAAGDADAFTAELRSEVESIAGEFRSAEPGMTLEVEAIDTPDSVWSDATAATVMNLIQALPHGVMSMSYAIPELVETSTNLATVKTGSDSMSIHLSSRSSVASALQALRQRIRATAGLVGASVEEDDGYPGWEPDMDSELLGVVQKLHEKVLGSVPRVEAIHAGLECGLIGKMIPGMDMISFGPQIEFPHSPDERVKIDTVGRFYQLLTATLEELA